MPASCKWVAVIVDQFSRRVIGFALFEKAPTSANVCKLLERVVHRTGTKPKHIITDKGRQFASAAFATWSRKHDVRRRFGAVGKHGSVAVIERFIRSMKVECTRLLLVPFHIDAIRRELACYMTWYNDHRPHQGLAGRTPTDVHQGTGPPVRKFEPRAGLAGAGETERVLGIGLVVSFLEGRRHLPIVALTKPA